MICYLDLKSHVPDIIETRGDFVLLYDLCCLLLRVNAINNSAHKTITIYKRSILINENGQTEHRNFNSIKIYIVAGFINIQYFPSNNSPKWRGFH